MTERSAVRVESRGGVGDVVLSRPERRNALDYAAVERGHLEKGELCEVPGIGPISLQAARDLLGHGEEA